MVSPSAKLESDVIIFLIYTKNLNSIFLFQPNLLCTYIRSAVMWKSYKIQRHIIREQFVIKSELSCRIIAKSLEKGFCVCYGMWNDAKMSQGHAAPSSLVHSDEYTVTCIVKVGRTTTISVSFQEMLAGGHRKQASPSHSYFGAWQAAI